MRNAGRRIAERCARCGPAAPSSPLRGPGNNGGDAFAALAELAPTYECTVAADLAGRNARKRARRPRQRAATAGVAVRAACPTTRREARALLDGRVAVDGLFGTGARLPLPEPYRHLARALDARERPVVAIDIPSGIDALTGAVGEDAVRASVTVTLAAVKPGLLLEPAREYVGELWCGRIGIDDATLPRNRASLRRSTTRRSCGCCPSARPTPKNAGGCAADHRRVGAVSGRGRAMRARRGAGRSGICDGCDTAARRRTVLRMHLVEQVVVELSDEASPEAIVEELLEISKRNGAIAIGPGLGLDERTGAIFTRFRRRAIAADRRRCERALSFEQAARSAARQALRRDAACRASSRAYRAGVRSHPERASSASANSSTTPASRRCSKDPTR